jgi:hypothetical protein
MAIVADPRENTFFSGDGGLKAHWPLTEYSGTRYDLAQSNLINMTSVNDVESGPGIQDRLAAKFSSSKSQYLTVTDYSPVGGYFTFGSGEKFTIGFWFYTFSTSNQRLINKWYSGVGGDYLVDIYNGKVRFVWEGYDSVIYTLSADNFGAISTKKWYFVCVYNDASNNEFGIGVNDVWDTVSNVYYPKGNISEPLCVGRDRAGTLHYSGLMADLWVYKARKLTDYEMTWMYYYGFGHIYDPRAVEMTPPATPMDKPPKPTIHLSFNETSASANRVGDRWGDSTDTATQVNSPSVQEGVRKLGKTTRAVGAVGFQRTSSQYLKFNNNVFTTLGGGVPFEIAFWFQPHEVATSSKIVSKWDVGTSREYTINLSASKIRFSVADSTDTAIHTIDADNFGTLSNGVWYYVHVWHHTAGGGYIGVGVNDIWDTAYTGYSNGINSDTNNELFIARDHDLSTAYFDGYLDQLAIWRQAGLTEEQRTWCYNYGHGRSWADHDAAAHPTFPADKSYPSSKLLVTVFEYTDAYHTDYFEANLTEMDITVAGVIDDAYSLSWTERYNGINDFELELPISYMDTSWLTFGNIVAINSSDRLMVIEDMRVSKTSEEATLLVTGRGIEVYLEQRVLRWPWTFAGPAELLIYWLVEENLVWPTNEARRMEIFARDPINGTGSGLVWPPAMLNNDYVEIQLDQQTVLEAVTSLCSMVGFGWKLVLVDIDTKYTELYFHVYKGLDRGTDQSDNDPVLFTEGFDNVIENSFYHSVKGEINSPLVINDDEAVSGLDVSFGWLYGNRYTRGASEPIDRFRKESILEKRIDRDVDGDGTDDLDDDDVADVITAVSREEIINTFRVEIFDGEFDIAASFTYGVDYDLGDIVQVRLHGRDLKARITEFIRSYSVEEEKVYMALNFINE